MPPPAIVAAVVVLPWWIFHVMFSVVTFLHHTHPRVPWFRTKQRVTYFAGQVQATVHVELPTWVELLLHNITVHGAHHVDPRIPFRQSAAGAAPARICFRHRRHRRTLVAAFVHLGDSLVQAL